jgi:hypothetical protein
MAEVAMKMDVEKIWFFCLVTTNITPFQSQRLIKASSYRASQLSAVVAQIEQKADHLPENERHFICDICGNHYIFSTSYSVLANSLALFFGGGRRVYVSFCSGGIIVVFLKK